MSQVVIHRRTVRYLERLSGPDRDRIQKHWLVWRKPLMYTLA